MSKRKIYEVFNMITGRWEAHIIDEDVFFSDMRKLDNEREVLDAEIKIINKILEQQLNQKTESYNESRD
jgi:DNA-binding HxlR family transcriptional regulator